MRAVGKTAEPQPVPDFVSKVPDSVSKIPPDVVAENVIASTSDIVVCDGSVYDPSKPHLFVTLGNHIVEPLKGQTDELGFDATCGRMFSTVSLHDTCGVIVSTKRHATVLKELGYPVVEWGQTVAFPMCADAIKKMGVGKYLGAVAVHTFTEPVKCHNSMNVDTGAIVGDDTFDGCNHLAGAYIPLALALKASTTGSTLVNCETKHSGLELQNHVIKLIVGTNATSVCFSDGTGGSIVPDGEVIKCANAVSDTLPLVVTRKQVRPGFDKLIQEMSGAPTSFTAKLDEHVKSTIVGGAFGEYDKRLENDIRVFASKKLALGTKSVSLCTDSNVPQPPQTIDVCQLSSKLQKSYITNSMVYMQQPVCIGAPTVVVSTSDSTGKDTSELSGVAEESLYGPRFCTNSFTLEAGHKMTPGKNIHKFMGVVAVSHALFLSQISSQEAYDICAPFADKDSPFLDCTNPSCDCNKHVSTPNVSTTNTISSRFENMLLGVSQNIALTSKIHTGLCATKTPPRAMPNFLPGTTPKSKVSSDIPCTASITFCGTCKCKECAEHNALLKLGEKIASCTHAYQKCDNYVSDQTMCAINVKGVPQYKTTESMLPFGTALKCVMMKCGQKENDPIKMRVGMNTDDCENAAFETKAVMDTLTLGSSCVSGEYFHGSTDSNYNCERDKETIRGMRLDKLEKKQQRHILLTAEVVGKHIDPKLAYFVTGSASKAADVKSTKTSAGTATHTTSDCQSVFTTPLTSVDLSSEPGNGLGSFGSKIPGQRIRHHPNTNADAGGGMSGHCTCTLHIVRKDGMLRSTVVEGTAPVDMDKGSKPTRVNHRGTLSAKLDDDSKVVGEAGYHGGPFTVDNAVDMSLKALPCPLITTIATRLQVDGTTMRPRMFMGTDEHVGKNCNTFYDNCVSLGGFQCVQADGNGGVQPGIDVKKFLAQKVHPIITSAIAAKGEKNIATALGNASCGLIETFEPGTASHVAFQLNSD